MKKRMIISGTIILALITFGLVFMQFQRNKNQQELEDSFCSGTIEYREDGILYFTGDYIRYADNASGKDDIICVDQSCEHSAGRDSQCGAVISPGICDGIVKRGDKIYYIANESIVSGKGYLYSSDLTGHNRKKVGELCSMNCIQDVIYRGSKVYIQYADIVYENEGENSFGVYCYDMEKETGDYIYRETGSIGGLDGMVIGDNVLYYSFVYSDVSDEELLEHAKDNKYRLKHRITCIRGVDLATGKQTVEIDGYGSNCVLPYADGKLFYAKDSAMYQYDTKTDKSTKICDKELVSEYSAGFEDKVFFAKYNAKDDQTIYYYYDVNTEKLQTIGNGAEGLLAVFPDTVYFINQGQKKEESSYARGSTKDFLEGRLDEAAGYESLWQEE